MWRSKSLKSDPGIHLLVDQIKAFPIVLSTDTEDAALWKKDVNEFQKVFTAHNTWNLIRMQKVVQPWSRIVWFPQNVPRFAFVAWLAIKDRSCRDPGIRLLVDQIKAFPIVLSTDTEDAALWKKDVNEFQKICVCSVACNKGQVSYGASFEQLESRTSLWLCLLW
ncbi:hypothetical protein F2Q70_00028672 [Brassica cretica]|uniref:Reverse transcriptase zinc-binding domain-containing protein n=1 Tax=Brassica cretica TaxID=69181 RepID=A0A8S9L8C7_BRACR|nr:hypothetical protein F2Q70_00028672 [Brassica cretica]